MSYSTDSGVAPIEGFIFDSGDSEWKIARDRERPRGIGWASKSKGFTELLLVVL
jgi:hypothetical protein